MRRLEYLFLIVVVVALLFLAYNYYRSYSFKTNDLPQSYKEKIAQKEQEVLENMRRNLGFEFRVPLIVTDEFKGRLYGLTAYQNTEVKIYLNKKVMQESMEYMLDSVIAHEYAHAVMFRLGKFERGADGHSKEWQMICQKLGGKDCRRYVDTQEIIMSKMPFR